MDDVLFTVLSVAVIPDRIITNPSSEYFSYGEKLYVTQRDKEILRESGEDIYVAVKPGFHYSS